MCALSGLFTGAQPTYSQEALIDSDAYVRKAGVVGILKVWHLSPESIQASDMVDTVYNMIRDRDPGVRGVRRQEP